MPHPILFMNWVADVRAAGRGQSALKYLAAYLYRTAFRAESILEDDGRFISFRAQFNPRDRSPKPWPRVRAAQPTSKPDTSPTRRWLAGSSLQPRRNRGLAAG